MPIKKPKTQPKLKGAEEFYRKQNELKGNPMENNKDNLEQDSKMGKVNNRDKWRQGNFLSKSSLCEIRLLKSMDALRQLASEIEDAHKQSLLKTAICIGAKNEEKSFYTALMCSIHKISREDAIEHFNSIETINVSLVPRELKNEVIQVLEVSKAEERGFIYDEKIKKYKFNANIFAKHLLTRCHIRTLKDGRLFLYSIRGVFEELSEVNLGKIIRTVMHEGRRDSWRSSYEVEIIRALQREAPIVEEMDTHSNFINLKNGMLNLSTFKLQDHSPEYLSTIQIPNKYYPHAKANKFEKFMIDITHNNHEMIAVHQELIGYWLTGETKAEKAVYYYGSGANGKSVLASIISELVGRQNVSSVPLSKFNDQFGMESMIGKSLNISAENELGGKALKTENFKAIVSGDNITINVKYRSAINYRPHCRLLFLVNNLPDSSDVTEGYFRKLIILPFSRSFNKNERNVALKDELLEELPGILNWAISGLKRLRSNGFQFTECKAIEEVERNYYNDQNPVKEFFHSHFVQEDGSRTKQSDFYNLYIHWLNEQGIDDKGTRSRQLFWKYLKIILASQNVQICKKKIRGINYYDGLRLVGLEDTLYPSSSENN
ncbi:DNA primase family protein [Rossellomorea marisflavi]|uniref:DNA primase family protein n=1 Tax=Rossellomorea marisflavi TaxID=189381 RepID=UPI003457B15A